MARLVDNLGVSGSRPHCTDSQGEVARSLLRSFLLAVAILAPTPTSEHLEHWPGCTEEVLEHWPGNWPTALDWGLYWHAPDGSVDKAQPGRASHGYDPSKDTVIFFHGSSGSEMGTTQYCYRATTFCDPDVCHDQRPMMEGWFKDGWNVGFFYWDQFADESCARDAEQKIWMDRDGTGLRWASFDPVKASKTYEVFHGTDYTSIGDLCAIELQNILSSHLGDSMRFVGHGLGAQLAANCALKLLNMGSPVHPTRLTLLDPIFTKRHMKFIRCHSLTLDAGLGDFAAQETEKAIEKLWMHGVPTENIQSSLLSESPLLSDGNVLLQQLTLPVAYSPDWCDIEYPKIMEFNANQDCKHKASILQYFSGQGEPPAPLIGAGLSGGYTIANACLTPSAACKDDEIRNLMLTREKARMLKHKEVFWQQAEGQGTFYTSDDKFSLQTQDIDPSTLVRLPSTTTTMQMRSNPVSVAHQVDGDEAIVEPVDGKDNTITHHLYQMPRWKQLLVAFLGLNGTFLFWVGLQPMLRHRQLSNSLNSFHIVSISDSGSDSS